MKFLFLGPTLLLLSSLLVRKSKNLNEIECQHAVEVPHFTGAHRRQQLGDREFQIRQLFHGLDQIRHDDYIKKVCDRVNSLENDLSEPKAIIE